MYCVSYLSWPIDLYITGIHLFFFLLKLNMQTCMHSVDKQTFLLNFFAEACTNIWDLDQPCAVGMFIQLKNGHKTPARINRLVTKRNEDPPPLTLYFTTLPCLTKVVGSVMHRRQAWCFCSVRAWGVLLDLYIFVTKRGSSIPFHIIFQCIIECCCVKLSEMVVIPWIHCTVYGESKSVST